MGSLSELFELFRFSSSWHYTQIAALLAMELEEQMLTLIITGHVADGVKNRKVVLDGIAWRERVE